MIKLKIALSMVAACLCAPAVAQENPDQLLKKAMARDYQAQRNLAYSYHYGELGLSKDVMKACMWRTVIILSGAKEVDNSDVSNHDRACKELSPTARVAATRQAEELAKRIYK